MTQPVRVLVVGSANVDFTVALPRLPGAGETVSEGRLLVSHGGKGANQAVAARRLGAEVRFVGCVGDDAPGRGVRDALAAEGIGVDGLCRTAGAATGTALILVDADGRNLIGVAPGANRMLTVEQVERRTEDFVWADVLCCQLETPLETVAWSLAEARRRAVVTVLNPAPVPAGPIAFWPLVDWLTPNAGEAARFSGIAGATRDDAVRAAEILRERGVANVVVTLGEAGAMISGGHGIVHAGAFSVNVVDTTAAGDAFNGALAVALAERRPHAGALRFASAAAALACTVRGAQPSLPSREAVDRLLGGDRSMTPGL
jgi:ribokinase